MNKLKAAWNWVKEKWWIPLSGVVVLGVALLFRPKTTSLHEFMKNDRELEKETNKHINELEEATDKEAENIRQQTKAGLKKVKIAKGKKLKQIRKNKKEFEDELSKKTNDELAEMLRKEDEV